MNICFRQRGLRTVLLLLTGMAVISGCISFDSKDMQWVMGETVGLPFASSVRLGGASSAYYQCCGKWPTSVDELRSSNCADAAKQDVISNFLAGVEWNALTNVTFKTTPEGNLTISLSVIGRTVSTNGTSLAWSGGDVTETLESPKSPKN
jgi:hypothetical protein